MHVPRVTASWTLAGAITLSLLLAGCAAAGPLPTQTPPPTPVLAVTSQPPTAAPTAAPAPALPASVPTPRPDQQVEITDHFVIYYTPEVSPAQVANVVHYLEAAWRDIPPFVGIEPPSDPIRVYVGLSVGPSQGSSTGVITINEADLVDDYSVIPHEFTHVVTSKTVSQWMGEGLAMYMQERFPAGRYSCFAAISAHSLSIGLLRAGKWQTLSEFIEGHPPRTSAANVLALSQAYWESGSLVRYLVETYGLSAFQKLLRDVDGWPAAAQVYGKPVDVLVEEWRQHLARSTVPVEDCPACIASLLEWGDLEVQFQQEWDSLNSEAQGQSLGKFKALHEALCRKDAPAMQQHLEELRRLLPPTGDK